MSQQVKSLVQWSSVMLIALCLAFWASLPSGDKVQDKIKIVNIDPSDIHAVVLRSGDGVKFSQTLATKRLDKADRWWISTEKSDENPSASVPIIKERFMASAKFKEMLSLFAPFYGLRSLGKISKEQGEEFGLAKGAKELLLKGSKDEELLRLSIGKQLYGSKNMYVLNQSDQTVWLVSGEFVSDFEKPEQRAFERLISDVGLEEIQSASIAWGEKTRDFLHTKKDSKGEFIWTAVEDEATPVPSALGWFDRFWSLKAAMYATDEQQSKLKSLPVLFLVKVKSGGNAAEEFQVRGLEAEGKVEYWITSEFLSWHVKVATVRAEGLVKDLGQLFAK